MSIAAAALPKAVRSLSLKTNNLLESAGHPPGRQEQVTAPIRRLIQNLNHPVIIASDLDILAEETAELADIGSLLSLVNNRLAQA